MTSLAPDPGYNGLDVVPKAGFEPARDVTPNGF